MKQRLKDLVAVLFPPARKPPSRWAWTSLGLFLATFAGLCWGLDAYGAMTFAQPVWLGLVLLAPWVFWLQFAGFAGLPKVRGALACTLRLLLLAAIAMVLAEPRSVRTDDVMSVVYAVDLSDSIGENISDAAMRFVVRTAVEKPRRDEAGLVVFGKSAAVELPPRASFPFEAINSQIDRAATNLEQALTLSAAMIPEDRQGRIVLLSDGIQTEGNLVRAVQELQARKISVDVLPIDYQYERETWIERLDLPQYVKLGETYEAAVLLSSLQAGSGKLVLRENGKLLAEQSVEFQPGKNRFVFPLALRAAGYYEYAATIEVPRGEDSLEQNNTVVNSLFIEGAGRLLLVKSGDGATQDWQALAAALRESERFVEVIDGIDLPREAGALLPYDAILFVNVPHDEFDQQQIEAVREAVYNLGSGFLMVGGEQSFGPGGYYRTAIEEILPVTMDVSQKKTLPKGALAIVLHTCEFPEGNAWAKRICKMAINVLGNQDEVGLLAYDYQSGEDWIFPLMPVSKKDEMFTKVNGAQIGDMPSFDSTMRLGLKGLKASDASVKHMIIISDGDPQPPPPELLQQFVDEKISISTVAVFPHGGQDISKMQSIAEVTGGRYWFVNDDARRLPQIFIKEAKTLKRNMIQRRDFNPEIGFPSPILKGLVDMPALKGYVLTSIKPRAQSVLQTPPNEAEGNSVDPVLTVWQHGLGKTAAFTSDLSPNWGAEWVGWDHYRAFVGQLLTDVTRVNTGGSLRISSFASNGTGMVTVEDFSPEERFLDVHAKVSGPGGVNQSVPLRQVAPRRYQGTFPLEGHGRYHVAATATVGDKKDFAFGGFIVPYSPEYLRFRANPLILKDVARQTGGETLSSEAKADAIYQRGRSVKRSTKPVFDWFLWALAIAIPLDVGLRRVQLDWSAIAAALGIGRKTATAATTSALLKRKLEVSASLDRRAEERPLTLPTTRNTMFDAPRTTPPPQPAPSTSAQPPAPAADAPPSTTSRLLEMKRRRENDGPTE